MPHVNQQSPYGPKSICCITFCGMACILSFFVSLLMGTQMAAFTVPAHEHDWDLGKKSSACRKASLMYLVFTILIVGFPKVCHGSSSRASCLSRCWFRITRKIFTKHRRAELFNAKHRRKNSDASDFSTDGATGTDTNSREMDRNYFL